MGRWDDFLQLPMMIRFLMLDELNTKIDEHNEATEGNGGVPPHGGGNAGR